GWNEPESDEGAVPLSHYIWILRSHWWKILGFMAACVISTVIISARLTPIYEATASVDIDRQAPAGVIGQDAARIALNDSDQFLATQIKLIQSDSVLRPVVERYKLPLADGDSQANGALSPEVLNAPVVLKRLKVTRPPNTYLLLISYRSPDRDLAANVA